MKCFQIIFLNRKSENHITHLSRDCLAKGGYQKNNNALIKNIIMMTLHRFGHEHLAKGGSQTCI
jgi:hypothetical protein